MVLTAGCDETFSPIQPSELRLSVFGYLDVSADTQWIRVMPIRPVALTSPDVLRATVSIENLETGRVIELRDSLFRLSAPNPIDFDGFFIHNFWTTEPIDTAATFRFSATLEGGEPSEAIVTTPADYDVEVWIGQRRSRDLMRLTGVKHVAFAGVITKYFGGCERGFHRSVKRIPETNSDEHSITIGAGSPLSLSCGRPFKIDKVELWIAVSGSEWPSGLENSIGALGLPDMPSNISNSVGFLGGVLTKRLPYENCRIGGFDPPEYCRLRYDAESASVRGTVRNTCGTEIEDAIVELREAGIEPPANYRIRSMITRVSGEYEIAALEAGQRYALSVTGDPTDPTWLYHEYTDTLEFAPGEELTYDIELAGLDCGS